ncbi:MAG: hypothetical protein ACRCYX_14240 [Dermatophilaceae bacterium]
MTDDARTRDGRADDPQPADDLQESNHHADDTQADGDQADGDQADGDQAADDAHRLADAIHVWRGPGGDGATRRLAYAGYLTALFGSIYGFTLARAVAVTLDPDAWVLRYPLLAGSGLAVGVTALIAAAGQAGRVRGPVTPPLPWVDLVVTSSIDRALTLRAAWRMPLSVLVLVGFVLGPLLAAGFWAAGGTSVLVVPCAAVAGAMVGAAVAWSWLHGQAGTSAPAPAAPWPPARGAPWPSSLLRRLEIGTLREHTVRSARFAGGVLTGEARVIRMESTRPVRRGRTWQVRPRGPQLTVVLRDLLGLRRRPARLGGGAVVVAAGAAGITSVLGDLDGSGLAVAVCGLLCCHVGTGWCASGLLLLGDAVGAPRLLGGSVRSQAVAHSVLPAVLAAAAVAAVAAAASATTGGAPEAWVLVAGLPVALVAAHWQTAFRGAPPMAVQLPEAGPILLALWWAGPACTTATLGVVLLICLDQPAGAGRWVTVILVLVGAGWWAGRALRRALATARA